MKKIFFLPVTVLSLATSAFAEEVLIDESFEQPTGETAKLPPGPGEPYKKITKNFTAWANSGGQVAVTYGEKLGEDQSGGLSLKVSRATTGGGYFAINCEGIKIPVGSPEQIEGVLRALQVDFAIKAPAGKDINILMQASSVMFPENPALKDEFTKRAYPSRATLPKATGNEEFTKYSIKCSELPESEFKMLTDFVTDCFKNGASEIQLVIAFTLSGAQWQEGTGFSLDNVKVSVNR